MSVKGISIAMMSLLLGACASSTVPQQGQWQQTGSDGQPLQTLQLNDGQLSASAGLLRSRPQVRLDGDKLLIGEVAQQQVWQPVAAAAQPAAPAKPAKPVAAAGQTTTRLIYVAPERRPCTGVAPMQCLQVRERAKQPWQNHYGEIEGFQFEPGTAYRLRISEIKVANPPADAPDRRWVLDSIVEQIRIAP